MTSTGGVPSSRLGRTARIGGLAAGQASRYAGTRAANVARSRAKRTIALEQRHLQAADQILTVLGTMKGPAMKIGQLLAFVDLGIIPESVRPSFQHKLATLCSAAPEIPYALMEPVLARNLGRPVSEVFREIDPAPIGAASIGQVYRATLFDGREVAVKVQYPNIVIAAKADLKNLSFVLRLAQGLAPGVDMRALGTELTARFTDELDYAREARNNREMADAYAGHPFILVPQPIDELCTREVLVTEYVEGMAFDDICALPQTQRDRVGEIIMRFYLGSLFRLGRFSGDPHPGNLKLLPDGRVAFFDFGSYQRLDEHALDVLVSILAAAAEGRGADMLALLGEEHWIGRPDETDAGEALDFADDVAGWFLIDEVRTMTPSAASDAIMQSLAPRSDHRDVLRGQDLPTEHALLVRTLISAMGLLGQLAATGNWHRIGRDWIYSDAPATELGQRESDYFALSRDR